MNKINLFKHYSRPELDAGNHIRIWSSLIKDTCPDFGGRYSYDHLDGPNIHGNGWTFYPISDWSWNRAEDLILYE